MTSVLGVRNSEVDGFDEEAPAQDMIEVQGAEAATAARANARIERSPGDRPRRKPGSRYAEPSSGVRTQRRPEARKTRPDLHRPHTHLEDDSYVYLVGE